MIRPDQGRPAQVGVLHRGALLRCGLRRAPAGTAIQEDNRPDGRRGAMPGHTVARSAVRGAIASMAMSGLRRVTTSLGWLERTPPEAILADGAPTVFRRVPVEQRAVLVEAAHLGYGTLGGVAFGLLPQRLRRSDWVGPAYGALL